MAKSLLEKAKSVPTKNRVRSALSDEEIELAIAWLNDEVTLTQAATAMGYKSGGAWVARVALLLREAFRTGIIKVVSK